MKKKVNVLFRLQEYLDLKEGIVQEIKNSKNIQKGFLAASLPLLTVGAAIAQCQGPQAANLTLGEGTTNGLRIDVDGDGSDDFIIYERNVNTGNDVNLMFDKLGAGTGIGALTNGGSGIVNNYNLSAPVNGNGVGTSYDAQWLAWKSYGAFDGNFSGPYPTSGYIGIKMGTKYGFIQLTVESGPELGNENVDYVISVAEAGLQNATQSVLAGNCLTLPVELTSFNVKAESNNALLQWETASEQNNSGFEIERSKDGTSFKHLHFAEGKGNSSRTNDYQYTDKGLSSGQTYYYRLKQVDFNGRYEYSDVVSVTTERTTGIVGDFYPNPINGKVAYLNINVKKEGKLTTRIFDAAGKEVYSTNQIVGVGENQLEFDLSALSKGIYFAKIKNNSASFYKKLIVD